MNKEDFREWKTHPFTVEVFELLRARRHELTEILVLNDLEDKEAYRIRGQVNCMDDLMSGDFVEEDEEEE
jgi:hypothetical protein